MIFKSIREFGLTCEGNSTQLYELRDEFGYGFSITNYGAALVSLIVPDKNMVPVDVLLGFDTVNGYERHNGYAGAICGRMANRIGSGSFYLNDVLYSLSKNENENHLHGGSMGFDKRIWNVDDSKHGFTAHRVSPHMEENYPGNLVVQVAYEWFHIGLKITYHYSSDMDTICNLTNHAYFNLNGHEGRALDQELSIYADYYTPLSDQGLPNGEIVNVKNILDFRQGQELNKVLNSNSIEIQKFGGLDHNFVLAKQYGGQLSKAATLTGTKTGISMNMRTTLPGLQVYTGNHIKNWKGKGDIIYNRHDGVALETQFFPNATAHSHFPSPIAFAGRKYNSVTIFEFSIAPNKFTN